MRVEILIYCYGAICLGMIVFNCACVFAFRKSDNKIQKKSRSFESKISEQIEKIKSGEHINGKHMKYLEKKLSRVGNLRAFDAALDKLQNGSLADKYLKEINYIFIHLTIKYKRRETMQAAYYLYFLAKYKICRNMNLNVITDMVKDYMKSRSLYCSQNAMKVLYSSENAQSVLEGIKIIENENIFFHSKILSEGLLTFAGDHSKLIRLLWNEFNTFKTETQTAILNYIRFKSGDYCDEMLKILENPELDQELRFSAIRYFGKYKYIPACQTLMDFVSNNDELLWNYAAFSATSLAAYPGDKTVAVLKNALYSSNWYIRYNAAQSLCELGAAYQDLIDVINGNDRYAREMLLYQFDSHEMDRKEVKAV